MVPESKKKTDQSMIDEFLAKGGKITKGKTKEMPRELSISNVTWGNPMTKQEKECVENSEKTKKD